MALRLRSVFRTALSAAFTIAGAALLAAAPADTQPAPQTQPAPETQHAATAPHGNWVNVTHNVGGDKWGFAGVTVMAAVPGSDEILAGVSEQGIWSSTDGGKTWNKLAGDKDSIKNRPYQILFDPQDPKIFWESGNHGPGIFKTTDGGKSFVPIGAISDVDGIGVDFADPARKIIVAGHHDQERSTDKSSDAGKTWEKIGRKLPEKTNISDEVILLDAKTYIVNAAGWKQGLSWGIFRTEDGGNAWAKVADFGPDGPPLVASDGAIYWQALWDAGLIKSSDKGKTWQMLPGSIKSNPIEMAPGKLVAPVGSQLHVSVNGGTTWEKFADPLPFKPSGLVWCAKTSSLYAWRSTESREENVIIKWEVP